MTIVDEQQYQSIAENILNNQEFSIRTGQPTSIRPPVYPAFLSLVYFVTGGVHLDAVRFVQIVLSLGIIYLIYLLGKDFFDEKTGLLAALIFAVYPSFIFATHLILTEVLFSLLFILYVRCFLASIGYAESANPGLNVLVAGVCLALAALTRSILYPFIVLSCLFLLIAARGSWMQKGKLAMLLVIGYAIVIAPWAVRNAALYESFVPVGTMGGLNMYMGNYEHTPLNRAWDAISLYHTEKGWEYGHEEELSPMNEAEKQEWAIKKAREFILNNKLLTLKRDIIKAANFWGLERTIVAGIVKGHWPGMNNKIFLIVIALLIFAGYFIVVQGALFGIFFNVNMHRYNTLFMVLLILYFTGMHSLVFGHSRYHLPLIPLMAVFASWSLLNLKEIWASRKTWRFRLSAVSALILIYNWIREVVFVEGARYLSNINIL